MTMRQPDKNRIKRAMEHIMAAITNINSIKWENRTPSENKTLDDVWSHLAEEYRILRILAERKDG